MLQGNDGTLSIAQRISKDAVGIFRFGAESTFPRGALSLGQFRRFSLHWQFSQSIVHALRFGRVSGSMKTFGVGLVLVTI
jgi:hypothetical protein